MHTIASLKTAFEDYLGHAPSGSPEALYQPVTYTISQSGKRVRPMLLLLSYSLFASDFRKALPAALALEYFHNFTLVHDDIMDAAPVRRGQKSVFEKFGVNAAILSGDLLLIKSFDLMLGASAPEQVHRILGEMSDVAARICEGQQRDMDFEQRDLVGVEDYLLMVEQKTAVLLGCAMYVGALLAGASDQQADTLQDIGIQLGKAFQIHDDLLDAYGDVARVGKRRGGDILQKKKSILYALAWDGSSDSEKRHLAEIYNASHSNPEVKILQVLSVFDKCDVQSRAEALRDGLYREGMDTLERLSVPVPVQLVVLRDFLHGLAVRES